MHALGVRSIAVTAKGLVSPAGTAAPVKSDSGTVPAASLRRAFRTTAHLPTRLSLVVAGARTIRWKISGALLDGFWVLVMSLWPWFYLRSTHDADWRASWLLGAIMLASILIAFTHVAGGAGVPLAKLRRSVLLLLWPLVFVIAAPSFGLGVAGLALFARATLRTLPAWWPRETTFEAGLPLSAPIYAPLVPLAWLGLVLIAFLLIRALVRRWGGAVLGPSRFLNDMAYYLGSPEHRDRAQIRLKAELGQVARSVSVLVVGAHGYGSVLAVDTLRRFGLPKGIDTLVLITCGSPLKRFLSRFFPAAYPEPSYLSAMLHRKNPGFEWFNLYRPRDPVGADLELEPGNDISTGQARQILTAHTGYFEDPVALDLLSTRVAKILDVPDDDTRRTVPAEPSNAADTTEAYARPRYLTTVEGAKRRAWIVVAILSLAMWGLSAKIRSDRNIVELSTQPTAGFDGYLMARQKAFHVFDAQLGIRPTFWVEYWPVPGEPSVCIPIDGTVDRACMLSAFFPEIPADGSRLETRSCFEASGFDPTRLARGRFVTASVKAIRGHSGPATIVGCKADPKPEIVRGLALGVTWLAPGVVLLMLVHAGIVERR